MDEISTGLDSSTTFQIIKSLRDFAHLRLGTVLVSLLQPPPEVYNLFDDVLLLSEGANSAFRPACKASSYVTFTCTLTCPLDYILVSLPLSSVCLSCC